MERECPYLYIGSKFRVIWPSVLIIQDLGKYVWEKPSGDQGLKVKSKGSPTMQGVLYTFAELHLI